MLWYGLHNKTVAQLDSGLLWLLFAWTNVYLVFCWFVATSRQRRLETLILGTLSISAGALLSVGLLDSNWMAGGGPVIGTFSRWGRGMKAEVSVHIGLRSVNITLISQHSGHHPMYFNEIIELSDPDFKSTFRSALERGLPHPVLSVVEFLCMNRCGFKTAGYMTDYLLTWCLLLWALNQFLYLAVPQLAARASAYVGLMIMLSVVCYLVKIKSLNFIIYIEGCRIQIDIGRSVYLVLGSAFLHILPGILSVVSFLPVPRNSFELDFGTPFDQETIQSQSMLERRRHFDMSSRSSQSPVASFRILQPV